MQNKDGSSAQLFRPEFRKYDYYYKCCVELDNTEQPDRPQNQKMWELMGSYQGSDKKNLQESIVHHVEYTLARTRFDFQKFHCYQGLAHSVRDRLIESFNDTNMLFHDNDCKRVYYLSLEFLIGRCLQNALVNLDLEGGYKEALEELGYQLEQLYEEELDPALGNGGLGYYNINVINY